LSQAPQVTPEDIKKAVDTVAELRKMLEEKLKAVDELDKKIKELEKTINTLNKRIAIQRVIIKHLIRKARPRIKPIIIARKAETKPEPIRPRPERVFKSEEVRKKLEELRKKILEKRASRHTTPRPEATTTPEPASGDSEEFREFIKKVLSGKATASDIPVKFRTLPEVKIEKGGEKK
jgi:TolA-binding protein